MYKRVEALGGQCGVDSRKDGLQGSVFWFTFPYRPDFNAAEFHANEMQSNTFCRKSSSRTKKNSLILPCIDDEQNYSKPLKILLVDDSASILKVTSRLLRMQGHIVETAANGFQGLEKLKEGYNNGEYDLMLTDLQMPVMDGFECTERFRLWEQQQRQTQEALGHSQRELFLIVGMSANSDNQSKQQALELGMNEFLVKPFPYKDLHKIFVKHCVC